MAAKKPVEVLVPGGEDETVFIEPVVADVSGLPDASTVDLQSLTRPVLTAQGWLLPNGGQ